MMKSKLARWILPLTLALSFGTACVKKETVEVYLPRQPCPLPAVREAPALSPGSLGDLVTLTIPEVKSLGLYIRDLVRHQVMSEVCNDNQDAP